MSKAAELANLIGNINAGGGGVNRNLLINGSMAVAQRGTSHTTASAYTLDRWTISETTDGAVTITQDSSVPTGSGLSNSYKLDVTTADTSLSSAQRVFPHQIIEAQNLQHLQYGTSEAKPLTLSFYVKSNVTGTYTVLFSNFDSSRHRASTYTIDSANTWEQKKITISGDTASSFDDDNEGGLEIAWWLSAGSAYTSGTLGTAWQASDATDKVSSSNVNIMSSTDNDWFLTGCQLEVGQNATEFEHEPVERTLLKCQRYYHRLVSNTTYDVVCHGHFGSDTVFFGTVDFPVTMRAEPTLTESGDWRIYTNTGVAVTSGPSVNRATTHAMNLEAATGDNNDIGQGAMLTNNNDASAFLEFKAEL